MVTTSSTKARAEFADLLNRVIYRNETVVINRRGKPCAAIIPVHALETLKRLEVLTLEDRVFQALEEEHEGKDTISVEGLKSQLGL